MQQEKEQATNTESVTQTPGFDQGCGTQRDWHNNYSSVKDFKEYLLYWSFMMRYVFMSTYSKRIWDQITSLKNPTVIKNPHGLPHWNILNHMFMFPNVLENLHIASICEPFLWCFLRLSFSLFLFISLLSIVKLLAGLFHPSHVCHHPWFCQTYTCCWFSSTIVNEKSLPPLESKFEECQRQSQYLSLHDPIPSMEMLFGTCHQKLLDAFDASWVWVVDPIDK